MHPFIAAAAGAMIVGASMAGIEPAFNVLNQWAYKTYPNALPSVQELIELHYRGIIDQAQFEDMARRQGFDNVMLEELVKGSHQLLMASDVIKAKWRGIIDEGKLDDTLEKLKFSDKDADILKKVSRFFPSPPDLVRFAVREVYTPAIVDKFEMMADLPDKFITEGEKAGLDTEQAKNFWAAHWDLPSPLQGFRMLHRGIIDEKELELLLKALDIMPYWRKRIIQLSYTPLTRVDVRRMYDLDVLDESGVMKAYKDIGYNDENALKMTAFTVKFVNNENKGITRSSVVSAYKKGAITTEELGSYLKVLGFSDKVVKFWFDFATYDKFAADMDDIIDALEAQYIQGVITETEFTTKLSALAIPSTYAMSIKAKADLKRQKSMKLPSKEDLMGWLQIGVIAVGDFGNKMSELGYRDSDIGLYLDAIQAKAQA